MSSSSVAVAAVSQLDTIAPAGPKTYDSLYDFSAERWFDTRRMVEEAAVEDEVFTPYDLS